MTPAQQKLATLVEWVKGSSASYKTPLGGETKVGRYAVFIPQALSLPPDAAGLGPGHLPLWIPESQAVRLPPFPSEAASPPASQPRAADRLLHLLWTYESGRFSGALVPLTNPVELLQAALDRHAPGLDLAAVSVVFVPLWDLTGSERTWAERRMPLVRV